jgi:predicted ribosome quality control (RQC) complex YloA/Tae2 family protein
MSAAIEQTVGSRESRDALDASRSALIAEIDRARRATARRIASLREGLEAAGDADTIMQRGRLLLAYQHAAEPGSAELAIPDLGITIPLDPRLTPAENAERLFRRYRKLREAQRKLPAMIRAAESEAARLDDLARFAQIATSEGELAELRRDLRGERQQPTGKQAKGGKSRGPMRVSLDGYTLLVGRNARENDEVTFRLAGRNAIWLHVRERTGSHVVIQNDGSSIPERVLERAAQIAAYFSEARTDSSADVDVARVRDVRKVPGGPPGRVTYRNFRTVRVTPEKP